MSINILSLLCLLFCLTLGNASYGSNYKLAWALRQNSSFAGTVNSDLTDNALKMHVGRLGLTIITKAPKWNALIFNENSKTYVDLPYKAWQKKFTLNNKTLGQSDGQKPILKVRSSGKFMKIGKFRAYECVVLKKVTKDSKSIDQVVSRLWLATDIKAPPQIAQIFCTNLGIPVQKGIPLRAERLVNGKMMNALDTISVKTETLPASAFEPVAGYKRVSDEFELVMGESSTKAMEDLLDVPSTMDKKK